MPPSRRTEIRRLLRRREREGLSYRELAAEVGLAPGTLQWWAWKLRHEDRDGRRPSHCSRPAPAADLVEVVVADPPETSASAGPFELVLATGTTLRVPAGFDAGELSRLLSLLTR